MINNIIDYILNNIQKLIIKLNIDVEDRPVFIKMFTTFPESFIQLINFKINLSKKKIMCSNNIGPFNNVHDILKIIHINDNKKCAGEQLFDIYNKINSNFPDFFKNLNNNNSNNTNSNNNNLRGLSSRTKKKAKTNQHNQHNQKSNKK